jgi:hypothetical protein
MVRMKGNGSAMSESRLSSRRRECVLFGVIVFASAFAHAGTLSKTTCQRVTTEGRVNAGREWNLPLGEDWIFRILPVSSSSSEYSGWDLVVDHQQPAGFPDALLLATLPYNSINEREIGTTFGLRAQDAIGWNPRSFRFLLNSADFREAQQLFRSLMTTAAHASAHAAHDPAVPPDNPLSRLVELRQRAASGELRILDAAIVPGVADPAPYAQAWALAASRTPHQIEAAPAGTSSPLGMLNWMRFSLTLWFPARWRIPSDLHPVRTACPE